MINAVDFLLLSGGGEGGGTSTPVPGGIRTGIAYTRYDSSGAPIEAKRLNLGNVRDYEFYMEPKLEKVDIGERVRSIGNYGFYGCESLNNLVLPDGIEYIGEGAFAGCTSLNMDTVSAGTVHSEAFKGCTSLTKVKIKSAEIHPLAFADCTELKAVWLSAEVVRIITDGRYSTPFTGCRSLTKIFLENQNISGFDTYWQHTGNSTTPTIYYNVSEASFDAREV